MIISIILTITLLVHILFLLGAIRQNFAIMDIGWGLGFIFISAVAFMHHPLSAKNALVVFVVMIWGIRLALYLISRSRGAPEDARYAKFRKEWGRWANVHAYFKVYLLQGFLMFMIALPIIMLFPMESQNMSWLNWLGLFLWGAGFLLETWADLFLLWFRRKKPGQFCTEGPWKFCRYPNYFGEITLWYGIYLLCFELPIFWTIIGPMVLHYFILKVTGVPLLEERYQGRPGYAEYAARVPKMIPFTKP